MQTPLKLGIAYHRLAGEATKRLLVENQLMTFVTAVLVRHKGGACCSTNGVDGDVACSGPSNLDPSKHWAIPRQLL